MDVSQQEPDPVRLCTYCKKPAVWFRPLQWGIYPHCGEHRRVDEDVPTYEEAELILIERKLMECDISTCTKPAKRWAVDLKRRVVSGYCLEHHLDSDFKTIEEAEEELVWRKLTNADTAIK